MPRIDALFTSPFAISPIYKIVVAPEIAKLVR